MFSKEPRILMAMLENSTRMEDLYQNPQKENHHKNYLITEHFKKKSLIVTNDHPQKFKRTDVMKRMSNAFN